MRWLLVVLLVTGCSTEIVEPPPTVDEDIVPPPAEENATFTYHQDIAPLLAAKCTGCHSATGIAPFALDNYADASLYKDMIADAVETGIMPPFYADPNCNEYEGDPSLTADEMAMLRTWANENAPLGDDTNPAPLPEAPALSPATVVASMQAPYTQVEQPDENRCFLLEEFDVPAGQFITGFRVFPGNADVVHHILVFLVPPDQVADIDASPEGFACNGGMMSSRSGGGLIGAWAPGGLGTDMPDGLGVAIAPGSRLVVQMHYNSNKSGPQADQTQIGLVLSPTVEREARFFFYTDPRWLRDGGMLIPAGDVASFEGGVQQDIVGSLNAESIEIYSAAIHMHQRGVDAFLRVEDKCVVDLERWDFNWQQSYQPKEPVVIRAGERLTLGCTFDNSAGDADVDWGEGTGDEMCLGALLVVVNR